jgi:hypothetical protein
LKNKKDPHIEGDGGRVADPRFGCKAHGEWQCKEGPQPAFHSGGEERNEGASHRPVSAIGISGQKAMEKIMAEVKKSTAAVPKGSRKEERAEEDDISDVSDSDEESLGLMEVLVKPKLFLS